MVGSSPNDISVPKTTHRDLLIVRYHLPKYLEISSRTQLFCIEYENRNIFWDDNDENYDRTKCCIIVIVIIQNRIRLSSGRNDDGTVPSYPHPISLYM